MEGGFCPKLHCCPLTAPRLLLLCLCIPCLPWLTIIWTSPLELRDGHGIWNLVPTNIKWRTWEDFCAQEPHRALLVPYSDLSSPHDKHRKPQNPVQQVSNKYMLNWTEFMKESVTLYSKSYPWICYFVIMGNFLEMQILRPQLDLGNRLCAFTRPPQDVRCPL